MMTQTWVTIVAAVVAVGSEIRYWFNEEGYNDDQSQSEAPCEEYYAMHGMCTSAVLVQASLAVIMLQWLPWFVALPLTALVCWGYTYSHKQEVDYSSYYILLSAAGVLLSVGYIFGWIYGALGCIPLFIWWKRETRLTF